MDNRKERPLEPLTCESCEYYEDKDEGFVAGHIFGHTHSKHTEGGQDASDCQ